MDELKLIIENQSPQPEKTNNGWSANFKNIALGLAGIISSILIPIVGYLFTQNQNDKEIQKSYIELGIKILSATPKKGTENVRDYAVKLINKYSDVKLEGAAKKDVVNNVPIYSGNSNSDNNSQAATITAKSILDSRSQLQFASTKTLGFDLSHYSKFLSGSTIKKANIKFVFIKATEGDMFNDPTCSNNVGLAKKYHLDYSLYHFYNVFSSAEKQAANFNRAYATFGSTMPLLIVLENPARDTLMNKNSYIDSVLKFISLLKFPKKNNLIIGTYKSWANLYLDNRFSQYKLFMENYSKDYDPNTGIPGIWKKADYWQYHGASQEVGGKDIDLVVQNK